MAKMIVAFATIDAVLVAFPPEKGEEPSVPEGSGGLSTVDEMEENLSTTERGQCHSFSDLNQATPDLQSSIIQACQLGLMGLKADGKTVKSAFSPNATITTAEIATTISRLLRGNAYQGSEKWRYHNHLLTLQKADIIPRNIDPMRKELRGTVFQMLMNTVKLFHTTNT
ncbi:MAG: hypothetical protein LBP53_06815 [Candidatus Peribacteria bacterium]|jgi:hypothetical protein|nr:hypothetical protein [Candidatus Peribacteria bacterium]